MFSYWVHSWVTNASEVLSFLPKVVLALPKKLNFKKKNTMEGPQMNPNYSKLKTIPGLISNGCKNHCSLPIEINLDSFPLLALSVSLPILICQVWYVECRLYQFLSFYNWFFLESIKHQKSNEQMLWPTPVKKLSFGGLMTCLSILQTKKTWKIQK